MKTKTVMSLSSPPPSLPEEEEERVELAVAARAGEIFEETGLFILCAALDPTAKG